MRIGIGIRLLLLLSCNVFGQNTTMRQGIIERYDTDKINVFVDDLKEQRKVDSLSIVKYLYETDIKSTLQFKDAYTYLRRIDNAQYPIYYTLSNLEARKVSGVERLTNFSASKLLGDNMIIAVIDGETALSKHIEFRGENKKWRVLQGEDNGELYSYDSAVQKKRENARLHATHVTGTILARGINSKAKGMAPHANVISYGWANDIQKIIRLAKEGVLVSNHSYGIAVVDDDKRPLLPTNYFGTYNRDAVDFDRVCYLFPYFQPVVAAGNDFSVADIVNPSMNGLNLLVGYSTAKNPIVVGAIDPLGNTFRYQTTFSSTGPTNDFRIKPDIVADGVDIYSTAFVLPYEQGSSVQDNLYTTLSGTSMATPVVSGILSLWQQWAIEKKNFPMRASTIKAVMVHTATHLDKNEGPSYRYGWGLIDAANGIQLLEHTLTKEALLLEGSLFNHSEYRTKVKLETKADKLSFTLVWTDIEGEDKIGTKTNIYTRDLVNDLDIRVYHEGQEYLPWMFNQDFNDVRAIRGDNVVDNVEKIEIVLPEQGEYEIVIKHKGELLQGVQDFALVVSDNLFKGITYDSESMINEQDITIWPNPADDYFYIEVEKDFVFDLHTVVVYDLNGRLLKEQDFVASNRAIINISDLQKGVYLVYVEIGGGRYRKKLVKK